MTEPASSPDISITYQLGWHSQARFEPDSSFGVAAEKGRRYALPDSPFMNLLWNSFRTFS
jgi:hypothetical protein